jgi:hypothetical protein
MSSSPGFHIVLRYSPRSSLLPELAVRSLRLEICEPFLTLDNLSHLLKRDLSKDRLWHGTTKVDDHRAGKYGYLRLQLDESRDVAYVVLSQTEAHTISRWLFDLHLHILFPSFLDDDSTDADGVKQYSSDHLYTTRYAHGAKVRKACQRLKAEKDEEQVALKLAGWRIH